jgi:hypothetical protein
VGSADVAGDPIGQVFAGLITELFLTRPFPVPADDEIESELALQLDTWCATFPARLPLGVAQVFISAWIRLYGAVSMEAFGQLKFALNDAAAMFEAEVRDLAGLLGMADWYYPPRKVTGEG